MKDFPGWTGERIEYIKETGTDELNLFAFVCCIRDFVVQNSAFPRRFKPNTPLRLRDCTGKRNSYVIGFVFCLLSGEIAATSFCKLYASIFRILQLAKRIIGEGKLQSSAVSICPWPYLIVGLNVYLYKPVTIVLAHYKLSREH